MTQPLPQTPLQTAPAPAKPGINRIAAHMLDGGAEADLPPAAALLHSNESAFGPSPRAAAAARAAASGLERYFENPRGVLAPAIAKRFGLDENRITVGHGSDDLLSRIARAYLGPGLEMVRSANGYPKTRNYAAANDAESVAAPDNDFTASVDEMLARVTPATRAVYLANPDNPSGTCLSGDEIRRLHAGLPETVLLVLDSAYAEYAEPPYESPERLVEESANVVMTRTFSKIFGLAGARVGWLYGPPEVVETVDKIGMTFPLSSPSAAAALAALDDEAHTRAVLSANREAREQFSAALSARGLKVYPSQTNFILVKFPDPEKTAAACAGALRRRGVLVRRFAAPAFKDCIRITLGPAAQMRMVDAAIGAFLDGDAP